MISTRNRSVKSTHCQIKVHDVTVSLSETEALSVYRMYAKSEEVNAIKVQLNMGELFIPQVKHKYTHIILLSLFVKFLCFV